MFFLKPVKRAILKVIKTFKKVTAPVLQKLSPSSKLLGPPKGFYVSVKQFIEQYPDKGPIQYRIIFPEENHIMKSAPGTISAQVHSRFSDYTEYSIPEQFVLKIADGRVVGESCYIISPDDRVIGPLSREFKINDQFHKMSIFRSLKLPKLRRLDKTIGVVGYAGGSYNYFHWMFDVLPRIGLLEKSGQLEGCDKIVINSFKLPFHEQAIEKIGLPLSKFIFSGKKLHLEAETLVVPSIPERGDLVPQWAVDYLKDVFRFSFMHYPPDGRKVYISRSGAANRRISNEQEMIPVLERNGFKIYRLENLTLEEQANIFFNASVILAPHGASLVNLIFSQPGTRVIEIFSPQWINCCYWILSNRLSLQYGYLVGNLVERNGNKSISRDSDITVDIRELEKTIESSLTSYQNTKNEELS